MYKNAAAHEDNLHEVTALIYAITQLSIKSQT